MSVLSEALDYTKTEGETYRVKECNNCEGLGNSMAVQITRKADGFLWHCFRCTKSGFYSDTGASPKQVQEIVDNGNTKKKDTRPETVVLPSDFTTTIPPKPLVQLYDLAITDEDIVWFDIGWSPSHARIIVPIYKYAQTSDAWAKKLVGFVGRKLEDSSEKDKKPKWYSVRQKDIKHSRFIGLPTKILHNRKVVIVEDVFSAIRISTTGTLAIALLTTYLPYELYPVLKGWEVSIWLDADAYTKSVKYQAALGANGVQSHTIFTDKDPKEYDNDAITRAIQ